jgi:branched-chain amino acid transport system substrate-binding protein
MGLMLVVFATALVALAATAAARTTASSASPIVIGWAFDSKGAMAPFDNPALAAAKLRVAQWNKKGGVDGRKLQIRTCDTQGNKPATAKACALKLLSGGANVIFTTCDVDLAAPVVQEAINRGVLAIAPCIGTDQMGPKRFGPKGKLAFSFGNVAQDEGSAMAQYAWGRGWRTASLATDGVIVYFKNVVQAFKARWTQLGGKVVDQETYHSLGGNDVQNAISRVNAKKSDVIVTATAGAFGALSTFISGLRSLGNNTPILNSWAGDGNYWLPKSPPVTNYYFVTYASIFGDDPNKAVNKLAKQIHAGTGGFLGGDRRSRNRGAAGRWIHERRRAGGEDGEVQEGADAVRARQLLSEAAHRVRPAVPRHQDPEQQGASRRHGHRQGRPEDLGQLGR